jgi:P-type E1-E2 ATPase
MAKFSLGKGTCAVGDGLNDVAMMQCANVGIAVGKAGLQAHSFADYTVP